MPDWKRIVGANLEHLDLTPDTKEEIIAELATHFEELDESQDNSEALALSARGWRQLNRAIYRAKRRDQMNRRKSLWIPMFVNLLLTSSLMNLSDCYDIVDLRLYRGSGHIPFSPQPWLLLLPVCGALAAFLARHGEGSPRERAAAAIAPSLVWLAVPFVLEVIFLCFPQTMPGVPLRSLALSSIGLSFFPALALLLGAVPFLGTAAQAA